MKKKIIVVLFLFIFGVIYANFRFSDWFPETRKGNWENPGVTTSTIGVIKIINLLDYPEANNTGLITANNHLAVQAAIEDRELDGITIIEFPAGEYWFNAPIDISYSNIVLSGEGSNNTILKWGQITGNCINVIGVPGSGLSQDGGPFNEDAEPIYNVGIEKITLEFAVEGIPSGYKGNIIHLFFAKDCWIRGIESIKPVRHHILLRYCENITITGSYFHNAWNVGGNGFGYGIQVALYTRKCLIENNIFSGMRHAMITGDGANNNVIGYNYSRHVHCSPEYLGVDDYTADCSVHGANEDDPNIWGILPPGPEKNLYEGNNCVQMIVSNEHNPNGTLNTFFRNKVRKYGIHVGSSEPSQNIVSNWIQEGCSIFVLDGLFNSYQGYPGGILGVPLYCFEWANQLGNSGPTAGGYCYDYSLYTGGFTRPSFFPEEMLWPPFGASDYDDLGHGTIPAELRWEETIRTIFYGLPNYNYDVCIVSGNVSLNEGNGDIENVSIVFDPQNSGSNIELNPGYDGSFSYVFSYNKFDTYNITYELFSAEGDYYPITTEDVEIIESTSPLILQSETLFPIISNLVFVSADPQNHQAFHNIQDAVDYLADNEGGTVVIASGTYTGEKNRNISWNGNSTDIYILGINDPVIDCEDNGRAFNINYGSENDRIEGLTIVNAKSYTLAGGAIRVKDGMIKIINNTFINCRVGDYTVDYEMDYYAWENSRGGAIFIEHENVNMTSEISGNTFEHCVAFDGGAIFVEEGNFLIMNNTFTDNHACWNSIGAGNNGTGGAIYLALADGNGNIKYNLFTLNSSPDYGAALFGDFYPICDVDVIGNTFDENFRGNSGELIDRPSVVYGVDYLADNIFKNHYTSDIFQILGYTNECWNNTFINNFAAFCLYLDISINNCVFKDNYYFFENETLNYCCIYNSGDLSNTTLNNCLIDDPQLDSQTYQPLWNTETMSPCIDTGDPASPFDPDETPSDIGAVRAVTHDFHLTTAEHDRYRYRSIPVIDRDYMQQGFETTYICAPVEEQTEYFKIFNQYGNYQEWIWGTQSWNSTEPLVTLDSVKGYKLQTTSDVEIPTSGRTMSENTQVDLVAGENWVGYFVKKSMGIQEAFQDIWDHIESIYSEDWAWESPGIPSSDNGLIYGKMYIVRVDEACSFVYGDGTPVPPKEREMTEGFYYVEAPTYSPINIESLGDSTVVEVGVFMDGECIGATQVEDFPLQILAFAPEGSRGSGEITFEFFYGGRSYEPAQDYKVLNKETGQYDNSKLKLRPYEFTTIYFGNPPSPTMFTLSGNYPNPFNPTTTIHYSIPSDGNVELIVYNIRGQKVKTLISGTQPTGVYNVTWNGKDENERSVSSGVYFYKLKSSGKTAVKKMLLLK